MDTKSGMKENSNSRQTSTMSDNIYEEIGGSGADNGKGRRRRRFLPDQSIKFAAEESEHEITRVMGCATMWHESSTEMSEMIKSIFRMDEDYSARYVRTYNGHAYAKGSRTNRGTICIQILWLSDLVYDTICRLIQICTPIQT
jgi:hypothetical protein